MLTKMEMARNFSNCKEVDYGIVVQSEGYDYARYAAFISGRIRGIVNEKN